MNLKRGILAALAVGVAVNVYDAVVHGLILTGPVYSKLTGLLRPESHIPWLVLGDFVAAFVFVWVYDRVYGSFSAGVKGGLTFGFYAGVLVSFPSFIFDHLLIQGFPYSLAWIWTIVGIVWGLLAGAVAGAVYRK